MERVPVVVGVGEVTAAADVAPGSGSASPIDLAEVAAERALADAAPAIRAVIDELKLVHISSWNYDDPAGDLASRLGMRFASREYGDVGGQTPVDMLHRAGLAIASGARRAVLVCGAEAQYSAARAARSGEALPWPRAQNPGPRPDGRRFLQPCAVRAGLSSPVSIYPLYEVARAAAQGRSIARARAEAAELYAAFSEIAAANPAAWRARAFTPEEIATPTPDNRLIAWPYTKRMVANPLVDMGAAVVVTSLGEAQAAGIARERMVFLAGGASASEPRDFLKRDQYVHSTAQQAVLEAVAGMAPGGFDHLELYSCFPCVPLMAAQVLGLGGRKDVTVTGGLSFFGAPLSNYMLHAATAMVRRVRAQGGRGLLYGQGEFVTKHHALVLARDPAANPLERDFSVQYKADLSRGPVPELAEPAMGPARIETATVLYRRDGSVRHGALVVRLADGRRAIATVPACDEASLARITDPAGTPVGLLGDIRIEEREGACEALWRAA